MLLAASWVRSYFAWSVVNWYVTKEKELRLASWNGVATIDYFDNATKGIIGLDVPYWAAFFVAAFFIAIPWMRTRFSLRTLLIATTLIAVVLGLIVVLSR